MILSNESNFRWHFAHQIKNVKNYQWNKMTYNEIYKIGYNKIIMLPQKNKKIKKFIVTGSVKQRGAQMQFEMT